jgi:hypothetical protein
MSAKTLRVDQAIFHAYSACRSSFQVVGRRPAEPRYVTNWVP